MVPRSDSAYARSRGSAPSSSSATARYPASAEPVRPSPSAVRHGQVSRLGGTGPPFQVVQPGGVVPAPGASVRGVHRVAVDVIHQLPEPADPLVADEFLGQRLELPDPGRLVGPDRVVEP